MQQWAELKEARHESRSFDLKLEKWGVKQRADQLRASFAVVVLPCRENVYPSQSRFAPRIRKEYTFVVKALHNLSIAEGFPFAELSPVFIEKAKGEEPLYYEGKFETPPTPLGYRVIGDGVADILVKQRMVPRGRSTTRSP